MSLTEMVNRQIVARGVRDDRVLAVMRTVPREAFVPIAERAQAYDDGPLDLAEGQTISQPYIVALMAEAAQVKATDHVLEVGTGSGYAAAVLSRLARDVVTIERHASLADTARVRLVELGYANVDVVRGDGTRGWADAAPYDAIVVAAGGPAPPPALLAQLVVGGRLVIPVGDTKDQELVRITRRDRTTYDQEALGAVRFVPLIGDAGWRD